MNNPVWFGKYRIIQLLGQGGTSEVYLAEHIKLHVLRAIKRIRKDNPLNKQILHEAGILKNLTTPHVFLLSMI